MKNLTNEEYEQLVDEGNTGVRHFMGGVGSKNGDKILLVRDKVLFFPKEEVNGEEYCYWIKQQDDEAKEWIN